MDSIILASASPRRRELLSQIGIEYEVIPSNVEEVITCTVPSEIVMELAKQKAEDIVIQLNCPGKLVLGADTIVALKGEVMGKPVDEADAFSMISKLQNNTHQVYTGVSLSYMKEDGEIFSHVFYEETEVMVYSMTEEEIWYYLKMKTSSNNAKISKWDKTSVPFECEDKAGAYGIQGPFAAYIQGISGDYNNVVGLPVGRVYQELKNILK
ncbi:MAG: Maf family protein [Lachnospiraceae bacterium]|nr:Maf family protein [Lachnospiraceae bacterium]